MNVNGIRDPRSKEWKKHLSESLKSSCKVSKSSKAQWRIRRQKCPPCYRCGKQIYYNLKNKHKRQYHAHCLKNSLRHH